MDQSADQQLGEIGPMVSANRDALPVRMGPIWGDLVARSGHFPAKSAHSPAVEDYRGRDHFPKHLISNGLNRAGTTIALRPSGSA